ncbi:receptor-like protein EIX2 [Silene latifolia]|uniref:receptor-like protein EIX2 n=1 Tax=Silene latifolia TaxID=37657 RepID=UPI003D77152C
MTDHFPPKLYHHLLLVFFYALLTCCSCKVASSEVNDNHVQCVESERDALLLFKQGIHVDHCGYLYDWGRSQECCQWHGIRCNNQFGHVISLKLCGFGSDNSGFQPCLEGTLGNSLLDLKHLKYLDLSINNFTEALPKFIGSLASLEHLNLSYAGFTGVIPQEIGNLSRLTSLDLKVGNFNMRVDNFLWLSRMRLLREVDLSGIDLSVVTNTWLSIVNNLPSLQKLHLDNCGLSLNSPSSFSYINSSTTLSVLSLAYNNLNDTSIFEWLLNLSGLETNLIYLDLSVNQMFGNDVQLSGHAMKFLDNLCSLQTLALLYTGLSYKFSDIVQSFSSCPHKPLVSLQLSKNQIWGSIPDSIGFFSSLRVLDVANNQLSGTIPQSLGRLTMLERLYLTSNYLNGTLKIAHLSNLSKLRALSLSYNTAVVVRISSYWIPPFQLDSLDLRLCKIGPYFPRWLLTQKNLLMLDISNASISDTIPISFWNSSLGPRFNMLDLSNNMIHGTIPDVPVTFNNVYSINLESNYFEGEIPSFLSKNVSILYLKYNQFSKGLARLLCPQTPRSLFMLDLSNNLFSENIPDCWSYFDQLFSLHLENNNFQGNLPSSMGALHQLNALHLSNNNLSGELPVSLVNCKSLVILDLAYNYLIGHIPPSFGHSFENLGILTLQNNNFFGGLPTSICDLSQLQILDISNNHISGTIPRCLYKLESMVNTDESSPQLDIVLGSYLDSRSSI